MNVIVKLSDLLYEQIKEHGDVSEFHKLILNGTPLPDNATNGDIIKAMFPTCKDWKATYAGEEIHFVQLPDSLRINEYLERWWIAPYRRKQ